MERIGSAVVIPGAALSLNNLGDSVYLTATADKASALLDSVSYDDTNELDVSMHRSPDVTGTLTTYAGMAGRDVAFDVTPGRRWDALPFALAEP